MFSCKSLMFLEQLSEPVVEHTVFIVDSDVYCRYPSTSEIEVAENITLRFISGVLRGNTTCLKLIGHDTEVEAGIRQIFGQEIEVAGSWHCPGVCPQWFDKAAGNDTWQPAAPHDCAPAINKAVRMRCCGAVRLPYGKYFVASTVKLHHGVSLCADGMARTSHKDYESDYDAWGKATWIIPYIDHNDSGAINGFQRAIVEINIQNPDEATGRESAEQWDVPYVLPTAYLGDIYFCNSYVGVDGDTSDVLQLSEIVCCLVGGGFTFEHVVFENFRRCIKWTQADYIDSKVVKF